MVKYRQHMNPINLLKIIQGEILIYQMTIEWLSLLLSQRASRYFHDFNDRTLQARLFRRFSSVSSGKRQLSILDMHIRYTDSSRLLHALRLPSFSPCFLRQMRPALHLYPSPLFHNNYYCGLRDETRNNKAIKRSETRIFVSSRKNFYKGTINSSHILLLKRNSFQRDSFIFFLKIDIYF